MDIRAYNRDAWNREVESNNRWTQPVTHEVIEKAKYGEFGILLTENKSVPLAGFLLSKTQMCCASLAAGANKDPSSRRRARM